MANCETSKRTNTKSVEAIKRKPTKNIQKQPGHKSLYKANTTKVDWKQLKKDKKNLKVLRKKKKVNTHYETIKKAKKLWEELRQNNCPQKKQKELTEQLLVLLQGNISKVARSHDITRIIQWIFKLGSEKVKKAVADEVLADIVTFSQCRYAHHTVKSILKYNNPELKEKIINLFGTHLLKLASSKISAPLVEEVYSKLANKTQKLYLKQEFYKIVFRIGTHDNVTELSKLFDENPDEKEFVLSNAKSTLFKLIEKFGSLNLSLAHCAIFDYLQHCNEIQKEEMLEGLQSHIRCLMKSKDGANIVKLIIWHGTTKVKKAIVKDFKADLKEIAMDEYGHSILMALIDSVDDTVLMKKAFIPVILSNIEEIVKDKYGRRVLLYIVAHRDTTVFTPEEVKFLQNADNSKYTKKDHTQRMKELLEAVLEPVFSKITENVQFWLDDGITLIATRSILKAAIMENKNIPEVWDKIVDYLIDESSIFTQKEETYSIVEHPGLHMVLKKIISLDQENSERNNDSFSKILVEKLDKNILKRWLRLNRGCFLLTMLMNDNRLTSTLKEKLLDPNVQKVLTSQESQGATILRKLINGKTK